MSQKLIVFSPVVGKDDKTHWLKLGNAFVNKDGSINVYLDGLPVNGRLQIREADPRPADEAEQSQRPADRGSSR